MFNALKNVARSIFHLPRTTSQKIEMAGKARRCVLEEGAILHPSARVNNNQPKENITVGYNSQIMCTLQTMGHGGAITIGNNCFISENTYIWSATHVRIGSRSIISHGVNIHDTDSHSLSAKLRHAHFLAMFKDGQPKILEDVSAREISIDEDVWIGFGATILKGVNIGRGAVVGAQSVVTKDVAPYTIVAGNPARVVGRSSS